MAADGIHHIDSVARLYAEALFELAVDAGQIDAIADEAAQLRQLIEADADLRRLLENRMLSATDRTAILQRIFQGRLSDLMYRFFQVVNRKDRMHETADILRAFAQLVETRRGMVEVEAYTAQPLPPAEARQIANRLGGVLQRQVLLREHLDPALIGGLKLRVGDQLYDGSVATQLRLLRQKMTEAGRDRARQEAMKELEPRMNANERK